MRILLADDHEIIRRGIRSLLAAERDYEVCGEAVDGLDAVKKAEELAPDLIIMDVSMPGLNGLEATRAIRSTMPACEVVILTQHDSSVVIEKAFEAGARGYVVKTSIARDLLKAVEQVGRHESFVDITEHKPLETLVEATGEELERIVQERTAALEEQVAQVAHQNKLLELANDAILVWNTDQKISFWNKGAERLYGWTREEALGRLAQELLVTEFPVPLAEILSNDCWDGELQQAKRDGAPITVASRWIAMRDEKGRPNGWLVINTDITARKQAEDTTRHLSGRLLRLQDEERRRIARDLHDSAGQYLAGIKMALDSIRRDPAGVPSALVQKVEEAAALTEACAAEIRTMSHLLHPPLLEELGLASAVRWYVDEFALRSGIHAHLEIPEGLTRLGGEMELVLFRVLQECLTNVHRHSGSKTAEVRIGADEKQAWIEVQDFGTSHDNSGCLRPGMGITGMRERVQNLAGELVITSDLTGTRVKALIPLPTEHHKKGRTASLKGVKVGVAPITKSKRTKAPDVAVT